MCGDISELALLVLSYGFATKSSSSALNDSGKGGGLSYVAVSFAFALGLPFGHPRCPLTIDCVAFGGGVYCVLFDVGGRPLFLGSFSGSVALSYVVVVVVACCKVDGSIFDDDASP